METNHTVGLQILYNYLIIYYEENIKAQVFAHNLSRFDVTFIFKYLSILRNKGYKFKLLIRDQQIISISIINKSKNISIQIRDSYLILPSSLKLSEQFSVVQSKLVEPVYIGTTHLEYRMDNLTHYNKDVKKLRISNYNIWGFNN